jgi:hypothetical protein
VLVAADQARALARYLTLVRRGVLDTSGLPASENAAAAWGELVIQPLSVEVLPAAESENMSGSAVDRRMGMR